MHVVVRDLESLHDPVRFGMATHVAPPKAFWMRLKIFYVSPSTGSYCMIRIQHIRADFLQKVRQEDAQKMISIRRVTAGFKFVLLLFFFCLIIKPNKLINITDFSPSKQTLPFLPKSSANLKPGHLAKVIAKNGRVVIGRVRYVGPLASDSETAGIDNENETYVGLQLPNKIGDCNGSFEGRKFFDW